ncbi:MAG TPA: fused MFS/spermidine synthase, partial [Planctomycetota bacterium]|nr:fused MFS/spermidine synthase [Planctomycetota bacterium]
WTPPPVEETKPIPLRRALRWIALAAVPSAQMLGVTTYMTTDVAAIPLLWIIPLLLYLTTFILVFSRFAAPIHRLAVAALPFAALSLLAILLLPASEPIKVIVPVHLVVFFVVALVCHGELAQDRPPAGSLTAYYLLISVGGLVGGTLTSLLAPVVFKDVTEYPLALVAGCALAPERSAPGTRRRNDFLLPAGLFLLALGLGLAFGNASRVATRWVAIGIPVFLAFPFSRRPIRFALGMAGLLVASWIALEHRTAVVHAERSFFGVHRILTREGATVGSETLWFRALEHGTTKHGLQRFDPVEKKPILPREPLTYYCRPGPIGQAIETLVGKAPGKKVAVVGLGSGTLAAYAEPGQTYTYFEIDPVVERIANTYFTYVPEARSRGADVSVVLGDARLTLARHTGTFDLIAIDAFSSDAIPLHLLTREAIARAYLPRLAPGGALLFHISNRYLDLRPILGDLAADAGLVAYVRQYGALPGEGDMGYVSSWWVALARSREALDPLVAKEGWEAIPARAAPIVWTDDESNLLAALHFR